MIPIFQNIIKNIYLHQLIIINRAIARFGVLDILTNNPIIHDHRFEINARSAVNLLSITLRGNDFSLLPNLKIEIDDENEEEYLR